MLATLDSISEVDINRYHKLKILDRELNVIKSNIGLDAINMNLSINACDKQLAKIGSNMANIRHGLFIVIIVIS